MKETELKGGVDRNEKDVVDAGHNEYGCTSISAMCASKINATDRGERNF
jgi:hypothetical protein